MSVNPVSNIAADKTNEGSPKKADPVPTPPFMSKIQCGERSPRLPPMTLGQLQERLAANTSAAARSLLSNQSKVQGQ